MQRVRGWKYVTCIFLSLLPAGIVLGQETTGGIRGAVTDPTGSVVPKAVVEVSSPALIRPQSMVTDAAGTYSFLTLPPGTYTINVSSVGFVPVKQMNIALEVGRLLRVDFKLEVGAVQQSVEVISEAAIVDTSQSTVAANVTESQFQHLPKGRDFVSLIALAPGARFEPKQGSNFQIDGASGSENIYIIDGMDQTNLQTGALPSNSRIPIEFVQEMQIKSSGFDAEYGGAMGGVINVVSRSGGNSFHGDAGFYFNADAVNAGPRPTLRLLPSDHNVADYFRDKRDGYLLKNPGASVGGPILKDKIWFFAGWDVQQHRWDRTVTFSRDNSTRTFEQTERYDYLNGRIDAAPLDRLRLYGRYLYAPYKHNGTLPSQQGTDSPTSPWSQLGWRRPGSDVSWGGDLNITPKLLLSVQSGYNYRNYKDYGIPRGAYLLYTASNVGMAGVPSNLQAVAGAFTTNNRQTVKDIQTRWRVNVNMSYIANLGGQHNFKWGYETNRLHNAPIAGAWPDGYFRVGWGLTYRGITKPGTVTGPYGYLIYRFFATSGDVSSDNMGFYIQDGWQVTKRLRLNLGLRTEREFVPSFRTDSGIPSKAIEFGFGEKLAPRLGFAYDLFGNAKVKLHASFGLFYDLMKYEMPRGSFGGDQWKDYVYPLTDPDVTKLSGSTNAPLAGRNDLFEVVDWRIPSNDPNDNTVDPNLKPMRRRVWDLGADWAINPQFALAIRYTHNSMDRAIEDVGTLGPQGEKYFIANPGFGITVAPGTWEPGFPNTPKARRDYDAVEFRLDRRFAKNYMMSASYTWSRLWGNYSGLASTDEDGRMSPNVNRYFDLPFMSFDSHGKEVLGLLPTDRPHSFRFFGAYEWKNKLGALSFGPYFTLQSGTPLSTQVNAVSSVPIFVNGRGDMGRTGKFSQTDLYIYQEFAMPRAERYKIRLDANFSNLFNQSSVISAYQNYLHGDDGQIQFAHEADFFKGFDYKALMAAASPPQRVDPRYGQASWFQGGRNIRFGFRFTF